MSKFSIIIYLTLFLVLTQSQGYLTSLGRDLAHLQSVSYEDPSVINAWSCSECLNYDVVSQQAFLNSSSSIQGYGAYVKKLSAVVITFRGSVDITNWLSNLNTITTSYPGCSSCNVHLGFSNAYKDVAPLVRNLVQRLLSQFRDAKLIITGHSLGGALAVFCALDLKELYGNVDVLYTLGQPRVGNQNFANYLDSQFPNYYRIVHNTDPVPHVPQSILGFKHGGHEIWYTPRGMTTYKTCVNSEDKSCSNSVSLFSMDTGDHSLADYYMKIPVTNLQKERQISIYEIESKFYSRKQIEQAEYVTVNKLLLKLRNNEQTK